MCVAHNEPEDVDEEKEGGEDDKTARLPAILGLVKAQREQYAIPGAHARQRRQYEKAHEVVEQVLVVLGGQRPKEPLHNFTTTTTTTNKESTFLLLLSPLIYF